MYNRTIEPGRGVVMTPLRTAGAWRRAQLLGDLAATLDRITETQQRILELEQRSIEIRRTLEGLVAQMG